MRFLASTILLCLLAINHVAAETADETLVLDDAELDTLAGDFLAELEELDKQGELKGALGQRCNDKKPCGKGLTCVGPLFPICRPLDCIEQSMQKAFEDMPFSTMDEYGDFILSKVGLSSADEAFEPRGWFSIFSIPKIKPEVQAAIVSALEEYPLPMDKYRTQLKQNCGEDSRQATVFGDTNGGGVTFKSSQFFRVQYNYYRATGTSDVASATFSDTCFGGGLELGLKVSTLIVSLSSGTIDDLEGPSLMFGADITPGYGFSYNCGSKLRNGCIFRQTTEVGVGVLGGLGISYCDTTRVSS